MVWLEVAPPVFGSIKNVPGMVRVVCIDAAGQRILYKEVPGRVFVAPGERSLSLGRAIEGAVADFVPAVGERWAY
jgi:hypothetical protein